ncbi:MAG: MTH938/NDUFAF3 family protein [Candidatus Methanofastidiosia archaeon]|jgi:hypothetical protein
MIEHYSFGKITIDGQTYTSDVIILTDTILDWWRDQGHVLNPQDLQKVYEKSPDTLVVGTGAYGRMKVPEKTRSHIKKKGITLIVEKTEDAVQTFNKLKGSKAAALHLTC